MKIVSKANRKTAGLKVRTDIRAGAYFSITFGAGGGAPGDVPASSASAEAA